MAALWCSLDVINRTSAAHSMEAVAKMASVDALVGGVEHVLSRFFNAIVED